MDQKGDAVQDIIKFVKARKMEDNNYKIRFIRCDRSGENLEASREMARENPQLHFEFIPKGCYVFNL